MEKLKYVSDAHKLTKEQFCEKTKIQPDCWIFKDIKDDAVFYEYVSEHNDDVSDPERYGYFDGTTYREFKHLPRYGETWIRVYYDDPDYSGWSLWSTWSVW